jgi:hypothetical protein
MARSLKDGMISILPHFDIFKSAAVNNKNIMTMQARHWYTVLKFWMEIGLRRIHNLYSGILVTCKRT